ncbi:MAG TPA: PEP/pyruvate-binding domain-containing protein [Bacillota bacterium]|nr:PEP/pyruvate-binding domain-containing protein [Bacillota bacterium]
MDFERVSTGLKSLDRILDDLRLGDNVVWQVDQIDDYRYFALFLVKEALRSQKRLIYFRFGQHPAIVPDITEIHTNPLYQEYRVDAGRGFESFSSAIREILTREGEGVYYIFDCLSELLSEWSTDLMIGNFFLVTCPYLFKLNTIAYFAILRERHSYQTIARIRDTTQILLEVFHKDGFCIHPLKVWKRYSPTMFLPYTSAGGDTSVRSTTSEGAPTFEKVTSLADIQEDEIPEFIPLTNSADVVRLFSSYQRKVSDAERRLDHWDRVFIKAAELNEAAANSPEISQQLPEVLEQLLRMIIGREENVLELARRYLTIEDLLQIKSRFIGSGFIGGKTVGLLLSRAILLKDLKSHWLKLLEPHDSFYIGSDVFYTYLVENDCWQLRQAQKNPENYFTAAVELKEKLARGNFPVILREQFLEMLEYFGQSPIIVRSSSLLEDGFGNAFAGKYESIFCANQGALPERYEQFIRAVRQVYASTMNEDALAYRLQRGLAQSDEQMALLVQRVSGAHHGSFYFPDLAGVALSYNLYVWKPEMDPTAGMVRLVLGLGTRAVDRVDDDYARLIALDQPLLRPESDTEEQQAFSQHGVDVLNLEQNTPDAISFQCLVQQKLIPNLSLFAAPNYGPYNPEKTEPRWNLDFENLLKQTSFPALIQQMLQTLQTAYNYPVDTEFTCNFRTPTDFALNLLQCRPLQVKCHQTRITIPEEIPTSRIIFSSRSKFMGGNLELQIHRIVYVIPEVYASLGISEKYQVARLIGRLNQQLNSQSESPAVLLGPGRWGTSTPSLGIPISFAEINKFAVLGEIAFTTSGFVPELSYGTHFFQDLVETGIFYLTINEKEPTTYFNRDHFAASRNCLVDLLPESERWQNVIQVMDGEGLHEQIWIHADIIQQKLVCWIRST